MTMTTKTRMRMMMIGADGVSCSTLSSLLWLCVVIPRGREILKAPPARTMDDWTGTGGVALRFFLVRLKHGRVGDLRRIYQVFVFATPKVNLL